MLLIKFNKQIIGDFLVSSFSVKSGNIAIIQFPNGPYFYPHMMAMKDIFTGKTFKDGVDIASPFTYADHIKLTGFRNRFFPLTVGSYLEKHANKESPLATKIYEYSFITPKTRINIFDLAGVDPIGGQEIYNTVKGVVEGGGAAVLIDYSDEFKNDCNVFVRPQYIK
jgi:O-phosphoseryl-tRNA(Cys) synthetase